MIIPTIFFMLNNLLLLFYHKSDLDVSFPPFFSTKKYAVIQEVIGITRVTPIPAQSIVIISALNIFEFIISPIEYDKSLNQISKAR